MAIQSRSNVPVFIYCLLSHPSAGHTIYTLKTDIRKQECAVNSDRRPEKIDNLGMFNVKGSRRFSYYDQGPHLAVQPPKTSRLSTNAGFDRGDVQMP